MLKFSRAYVRQWVAGTRCGGSLFDNFQHFRDKFIFSLRILQKKCFCLLFISLALCDLFRSLALVMRHTYQIRNLIPADCFFVAIFVAISFGDTERWLFASQPFHKKM